MINPCLCDRGGKRGRGCHGSRWLQGPRLTPTLSLENESSTLFFVFLFLHNRRWSRPCCLMHNACRIKCFSSPEETSLILIFSSTIFCVSLLVILCPCWIPLILISCFWSELWFICFSKTNLKINEYYSWHCIETVKHIEWGSVCLFIIVAERSTWVVQMSWCCQVECWQAANSVPCCSCSASLKGFNKALMCITSILLSLCRSQ